MNNEKGFTLIEVLASVVIISIVLMSFMAIFSNTNALAVSNSEKLVVINLADAYLERLKVDPEETLNINENEEDVEKEDEEHGIPFPPTENCSPKESGLIYCSTVLLEDLKPINERHYEVLFEITQDEDEEKLSLYNVVVTVTSLNSNLSSSVEGYLPYAEN